VNSKKGPQEFGNDEEPEEHKCEENDHQGALPEGLTLNLEADKCRWTSNGAKIENTGILF
jgi:hypothetical protein